MKSFPKVSQPTEEVLLQLYDISAKETEFSGENFDPMLFQEFLTHNLIKPVDDVTDTYSFTPFGSDFVKVLKNKKRRSNILKKMTIEDYLLAIHYLLENNASENANENIVSMTDIARYLGLSNSSISEYIRSIEKEGYIKVIPRKGVFLTTDGLKLIYRLLEKRNILTEFFNSILKIDLDLAEVESHVLEHNLSSVVYERLNLLINQLKKSNFSLDLDDDEILE